MALKIKHRFFLGAEWTILIQTGIGDHFCCFIATAFCIRKTLISQNANKLDIKTARIWLY